MENTQKEQKRIRYNKLGKRVCNSKTAINKPSRRKRQVLKFITQGSNAGWKYITSIPLTRDRNAKLPVALNALVPPEIRAKENGKPLLSIMLSKKLGVAIMFCRAVKFSDTLQTDGGVARLVPDIPAPLDYKD